MSPDLNWWRQISKPAPVPEGTRIELVSMTNDPDPVAPGTRGTVTGGTGAQLYVDWDNGRSLILLVGIDRYRVIKDDPQAQGGQ